MNMFARSAGQRVLVVTSIRDDVHSGGNTATLGLLRRLSAVADLSVLRLAPQGRQRRFSFVPWLFLLFSMPAPAFVALQRRTGWNWLEFFSRASPWLFLRCVWTNWKLRPDLVVLNHHSTFVHARAFYPAKVVMVWHDLPCLKRGAARSGRADSRRCAAIERWLLRRGFESVTFSVDDARVLRRLHGQPVTLMPVVPNLTVARNVTIDPLSVLLIGNWDRVENHEGAALLFDEYLSIRNLQTSPQTELVFHIGGAGADRFIERWSRQSPQNRRLRLAVTPNYASLGDFPAAVLLAPLTSGAGIKLKTIEAWAVGIPVIGTRQAFTGVPPSVWILGGICVETIADIARMCSEPSALLAACSTLAPERAFAMYQSISGTFEPPAGR